MSQSVFFTSLMEQRKTVAKLIEESRATHDYYFLLLVSAVISTLGVILDSTATVIGGMLVAPLLFPVLSLAMGVTTSSRESILRSLKIIGKSTLLVLFIAGLSAFLLSFLIDDLSANSEIMERTAPNLASFLVAFAAGVAASYTWVRQDVSSVLPGVAVSVSLIPPLCVAGVGLANFSASTVSGSATLFLVNVLGIVLASLIVFSLFGYAGLKKVEEQKIEEEVLG